MKAQKACMEYHMEVRIGSRSAAAQPCDAGASCKTCIRSAAIGLEPLHAGPLQAAAASPPPLFAAQLVRCYQGNHLLSGRTCQEQLGKYEDCMTLHSSVGPKGSFWDAAAAAAKQLGAEVEARRDAVQDAWEAWKNQRR
jgi:hypothetical protein